VPHALALSLAEQLIRTNTVNPPGNETAAVKIVAPLLQDAGFTLREIPYQPGRSSLIAHIGPEDVPPVVLSGHLDTVPLGAKPWSVPPFSGTVIDGKLFGRGAADMKSGVAVLVAAAIQQAPHISRTPLTVVLSSDEEVGCAGVAKIVADGELPPAACILVAEPTGNRPRLGHKGVFWLKLLFNGKTAHAAFPELGDNALAKAAEAVVRLNKNIRLGTPHPIMGHATLVTSRLHAGDNYNSVPDLAELGLDIRSTVNLANSEILKYIQQQLDDLAPDYEIMYDLPPIWTAPEHHIVQTVFERCNAVRKTTHQPEIVTFYTDGGILGPGLGNAPVIILGPGDSGMAHKVDEHIDVEDLREGVDIYLDLLSRLCN